VDAVSRSAYVYSKTGNKQTDEQHYQDVAKVMSVGLYNKRVLVHEYSTSGQASDLLDIHYAILGLWFTGFLAIVS